MGSVHFLYTIQQKLLTLLRVLAKQLLIRNFAVRLVVFLVKAALRLKSWIFMLLAAFINK